MRWRWPLALACVLVGGGLSGGVLKLTINDNYRVLFSKDNPQLLAYEKLEREYAAFDNIFFLVLPADGDVFSQETLVAIEELTEKAWRIPFARRVDSITNYQHSRVQDDDIFVSNLIEDAASISSEERSEARRVALSTPKLLDRIISKKGDATGINVSVSLPEPRKEEQSLAVEEAMHLADQIDTAHPGVDVHVTGILLMNNAFKEAALRDIRFLAPIMYAGVILMMFILLRSLAATLMTVFVIALSTATGMGAAGWLGLEVTAASAAAPTMILTLAVADCVHILVTLLRSMRQGAKLRAALQETLCVNLQPIFLTSLTTVIGFSTMNFSDSPPLRDLGNITAIGVIAAFVYSVMLLPALIAISGLRVKSHPRSQTPAMALLARFVTRNHRVVLWSAVTVVVVLTGAISLNEINDQWVEYFDTSLPFRQATDLTAERLTGVYVVVFSLESGQPDGLMEPTYLNTAEKFVRWLRSHPDVRHVDALTDTLKILNRSMHGDDPAWYTLPDNRELTAQLLLLYGMSLPYGLDLNSEMNSDQSAFRINIITNALTSNQLRRFTAEGTQWLKDQAPEGMVSEGMGPAVMFAYHAERNIHGMIRGTALAFTLIAGVLLFALRRVRYSVLSLLPNVVPALCAFGLWGLCVGYVGFAVSTVSAMTLGIVVDDTVHFLSKYVHARRRLHRSAAESVHYAFTRVGDALVATSIILGAGFFVLSRSTFTINSDVGLLTTIVIACALAADFFLLPPLLLWLDGGETVAEENGEEASGVG